MTNGDSISILLRAKLDADKSDINKQIQELSGKIKERLEIKLKISAEDLQVITKEVEEVQKKIKTKTVVKGSQFINLDVEHQAFNEITSRIRDIRKNVDELAKVNINTNSKGQVTSATLTYYNEELGQTVKETMAWSEVQKKVNNELTKIKTFGTTRFSYTDDMSKANKEAEKLVDTMAKLREKSDIKAKNLDRKEELAQSKAINKALEEEAIIRKETIGVFSKLQGDQVQAIDVAKVLSKEYGNLEVRGQSLNKTTGAYSVTLKQNAKENLVLKGSIDQTTGSLRVQNETVQAAKNIQLGFGEQLKVAIERSITWGLAMGALYGSIRKFKEGLTFIKDLDKDLTEISMITGMTRNQTRELALEYANFGQAMGKTVKEISEVNKELIRQGLAMDVAKDRLDTILKLSATAAISTNDALQIITSSVNAMGEDSEKTSDILLKAGAVSASSAAQIGEAFTKTASSAKATGMSIQELTSILATMIEITQESPASLGNSIKTLLGRFNKVNEETGELNENINQVQEAFESVGVQFLDSGGQIRNASVLLSDLSETWGTLDKNTKMYIATQAAGLRQQNRFLAIMDNYNRVQEIGNELTDAAGTTMQQYSKYLDSVEASANKAQVAFEKMWLNAINSDIIKLFYDLSISLTNAVDKVGLLQVAFSALLTVLILSGNTFKTLRTNIAENVATMGVGKAITNALSTSMVGLQIKTIAATVAVNALYGALTFGLSLGISLIITKITEMLTKTEDTTKKFTDLNEEAQKLNKSVGQLEGLIKKYDGLTDAINNGVDKHKELHDLQKEIAQLYPKTTSKLDEYNDALATNRDRIQEVYNQEKSLFDMRLLALKNQADARLPSLKSQLKELQQAQQDVEEMLDPTKWNLDRTLKDIESTKLLELADKIEEVTNEINLYENALESYNQQQEKNNETTSIYNTYIELKIKKTEELTKLYKDKTSALEDLNQAIYDVTKGEILSAKQVEELILKYPELAKYIKKTADGYTIEKQALDILNEVRGNSINTALLAQAGITEASYNGLRDRLKAYEIEIESIGGIAEAYKAMMPYLSSGASSSLIKDTLAYGNAMEKIKTLRETLSDPTYGVKESKSSSSSTDLTNIEIDQFYKLQEAIDRVNNSIENHKKLLSNTEDVQEQIRINEKLIELYKQQQSQLHNIAEAKRNAISGNVDQLRSYGFDVTYDRDSNDLRIANEERINQIYGKNNTETNKIRKTIENIIKQTKEWNKNNIDAGKEWQNLETAIIGANNNINEIYRKQLEDIKKLNDEKIKIYENAEKTIVDLLKKRYKQQKDIEDKRHKEEIDRLKDQKDKYKDMIDSRISEMDRLKESQDYQKDVDKISQELLELQSRRNLLLGAVASGDVNAISEVEDLDKKILEKREKLTEKHEDRQFKLKKQVYQDELKLEENKIDELTKIENESYENFKENMEKMTEESALKIEAQNLLINGTIDNTKNALLELFTTTGENATATGKIIQDQLISKLEQLKNIASNIDSISKNSSNSTKTLEDYGNDYNNARAQGDWRGMMEANIAANKLRGLINSSGEGLITASDDIRHIRGYSTGGINDYTGLAKLHGTPSNVETILNASQGRKLFDMLQNPTQSLINNLRLNIPTVAANGGLGTNIELHFDKMIEIKGNATPDTVVQLKNIIPEIADKVLDKIQKGYERNGQIRR